MTALSYVVLTDSEAISLAIRVGWVVLWFMACGSPRSVQLGLFEPFPNDRVGVRRAEAQMRTASVGGGVEMTPVHSISKSSQLDQLGTGRGTRGVIRRWTTATQVRFESLGLQVNWPMAEMESLRNPRAGSESWSGRSLRSAMSSLISKLI